MVLGLALLGAPALAAPLSVQDRQDQQKPPRQRATPAGPPGEWVNNDDYPVEARKARQAGVVGFRLSIDREGKVTACDVTASSGFPVLDAATCELMRARAKFTPARDKRDRPVADQWRSRFRWVLDLPPLPASGWNELRFSVGADGEILSCSAKQTAEIFALQSCDDIRSAPAGTRRLLGGTAARPVAVSMITSFSVDGVPTGAPAMVPPASKPALATRAEFLVDEEGRPSLCTTSVNGNALGEVDCQFRDDFEADGARHRVAVSYTIASDGDLPNILTFLLINGW